jgi:cysteine-rich repeat protein
MSEKLMRAPQPRRRRLTQATALVLGVALLGAGACGVDDARKMSGTSGDAGAPPTGSSGSNTTPQGDGGADGGAAPASGGTMNTAGKGGSGGKAGSTSTGGKAGTGGKGPSGPCGNNTIDLGEECDDGNDKSGDGCSSQCLDKCEGCESVAAQTPYGSAILAADYYFECYEATDYSTGGPAEGAPRAELCADVVDCVRRTGCGQFIGTRVAETPSNDASINRCWCKDVDPTPQHLDQPAQSCYDDATLDPGPCYAEFLNAAESDAPLGISFGLIDSGLPLGRAGSLFREIDAHICPAECWPEPTAEAGAGGTAGTGGTGGAGGSGGISGNGGKAGAGGGGSGGTSGSGGSGGGGNGKCGNGTLDAGEQCEPPSSTTCSDDCKRVMDDACVESPCEADSACAGTAENCPLFDGTAQALCFDVMECVRTSNCGDGPQDNNHGMKKCFCGELTTANCIAAPNSGAGSPAGACAPIIRQAFTVGATPATNGEVMTNFLDNTIPGGAALERLNCDWTFLTPECRLKCGF